jgi:hypothetical protein
VSHVNCGVPNRAPNFMPNIIHTSKCKQHFLIYFLFWYRGTFSIGVFYHQLLFYIFSIIIRYMTRVVSVAEEKNSNLYLSSITVLKVTKKINSANMTWETVVRQQ